MHMKEIKATAPHHHKFLTLKNNALFLQLPQLLTQRVTNFRTNVT